MKALDYLQSQEWSMGNGQCPECQGVSESWFGHPCHTTSETIGHKKECALAVSLKELGEDVIFLGDYKSDDVYESYWTDSGVLSMRIKERMQ